MKSFYGTLLLIASLTLAGNAQSLLKIKLDTTIVKKHSVIVSFYLENIGDSIYKSNGRDYFKFYGKNLKRKLCFYYQFITGNDTFPAFLQFSGGYDPKLPIYRNFSFNLHSQQKLFLKRKISIDYYIISRKREDSILLRIGLKKDCYDFIYNDILWSNTVLIKNFHVTEKPFDIKDLGH